MSARRTKWLVFVFVGAFIVGGWHALLTAEQEQPVASGEKDLIRLHIVANSDSERDQKLKLEVRDAVVAYLTPLLRHAGSAEEAKQIVETQREEIIKLALNVIRRNGASYSAVLETGWFDFPLRTYGTLTLPAGKYQAVRLLLGEAQGKNWWCVLFPPLCFVDATGAVAVPDGNVSGGGRTAKSGTEVEIGRAME